jgi:hypothetical protein
MASDVGRPSSEEFHGEHLLKVCSQDARPGVVEVNDAIGLLEIMAR